MKKLLIVICCVWVAIGYGAKRVLTDYEFLEAILWDLSNPPDYFPDDEPEPETPPHRCCSALPDYAPLLENRGWTVDQLIDGLITAYSNNIFRTEWVNDGQPRWIATEALVSLGKIDNPRALAFVKSACTNEAFYPTAFPPCRVIAGIYRYSDFGPETMGYMKNMSVQTNRYDPIACHVAADMFDCVQSITNSYEAAATTNAARFLYFALNNTTEDLLVQDAWLRDLVPEYSNSVARARALTRMIALATNDHVRTVRQKKLDLLTSLPTNELNNVDWIMEDVFLPTTTP